MIHDVPNPLYGCQHPFSNSAASVNIKLLSSIISPSFGPRTHELLPCGYKCRKVVKLFRNAKPEEMRSRRVLNCPSEPSTQLLWSDDGQAASNPKVRVADEPSGTASARQRSDRYLFINATKRSR